MNATKAVQRVKVMVGDAHTASMVGAHLLGEIADRSGLTSGYSAAVPRTGERAPGQDRGRLLAQVAMMLAGGGRCVAEMATLRNQPGLFGDVASGPTIWRTLDAIGPDVLGDLRRARAAARERVWAGGGAPEEVVLDVDATVVEIHSENKQGAAATYKGGYGFHPMLCFLDADGEALAGELRPGNAAANSGADQLSVVDAAIAQLPPQWRAGHGAGDDRASVVHPVLVRADTAGAVAAFVDGLVERNCQFSIGARVNDALDTAIAAVAPDAWVPALNADGQPRRGAQVAELNVALATRPADTRAICRREKPHPGAQLRLWDHNGLRHQVVLTNSPGDACALELRHRRHAEVENRIKNLKDCGLDRMPFAGFEANAAWMELTLAAADLLAWCRRICLDAELARAEPRTLRYRLLHAAGRLVRRGGGVILRLPDHWPWTPELATAYRRLALLGA